ncbi:hypothetical protein AB4Y42_10825 [Paraburkholderia sp. EG286B]|uniref:hypothetical protein n=1 Tax=Paraburkholderia sp. EG286B TaxID=3237011 RepID=UPI0034D2C6C5
MSKIAINTIVTGIVAAFLSLILSAISAYFSGNGGTIRISRPVPIGGAETTLVSIENESQRVVNGVTFELPSSVQPSQITADAAVKIVDNGTAGNQALRTVTVGLIAPRRVTTLAFSSKERTDLEAIRVLNARDVGLREQPYDGLRPPVFDAIALSGLSALTQGLIVALGAFVMMRTQQHFKEKLEEAKKDIDSVNAKLVRVDASGTKLRILLLSRINDYAKELEFWRNAIRSMMPKSDAEQIIGSVTDTLKTYGTRRQYFDFEAIKVAAAILREGGKELDEAKNSDSASAETQNAKTKT